jgi:hypothetical protein
VSEGERLSCFAHRSLADASGYQRSLADASDFQLSLVDASGYQRSLADASGFQLSLVDASGQRGPVARRAPMSRHVLRRAAPAPFLECELSKNNSGLRPEARGSRLIAFSAQSGHGWRFWFRTWVALSSKRVTGYAPVAAGVSKFYELRFHTMAVHNVCFGAGAEDRAMLGSNPRADAGVEAEWERSLPGRSCSRLFPSSPTLL